jgi:hypothetical protein
MIGRVTIAATFNMTSRSLRRKNVPLKSKIDIDTMTWK